MALPGGAEGWRVVPWARLASGSRRSGVPLSRGPSDGRVADQRARAAIVIPYADRFELAGDRQ
jgi:hypothetical protein